MEQASGQDLGWFFGQWLRRSGVPRLEGTWRYDASAKQVLVTLTQTQAGEPFRLPIEIGLAARTQAAPRVERVLLKERTATFRLGSDSEPVSLALDPGTWLLMEAGPFSRAQ
jgi:aminopeptidase N